MSLRMWLPLGLVVGLEFGLGFWLLVAQRARLGVGVGVGECVGGGLPG